MISVTCPQILRRLPEVGDVVATQTLLDRKVVAKVVKMIDGDVWRKALADDSGSGRYDIASPKSPDAEHYEGGDEQELTAFVQTAFMRTLTRQNPVSASRALACVNVSPRR